MAYTSTVWKEHSMDTAAKLTALDNLETIYTQAVAYIDGLTHAARYYTKAECNAKYFTSANDGTGSGLIAATLDGYTADQIIAAGIPSGNIGIWSGSEASIPAGWFLCNGSNGTPDLRNRFVVAAGGNYARGATGGANTVTTTATVTIATHALTAAEIPLHTHTGIVDQYGNASQPINTNAGNVMQEANQDAAVNTGSAGSGSAHGHAGSTWDGTDNQEKRPPYYALCWIQKA